MTPLPLLSMSPSLEPHATSSHSPLDRPERSRNAKAQARHRAKRKAYIEQLEQTVIRLQHALTVSPEQVTPLPPPVTRIRELEEENVHLHREIESLRHQLEVKNARLRPDIAVRNSMDATLEARQYDHEYRQRHSFNNGKTDLHTVSNSQMTSPTALSMPPLMHHYSHSPHSPSMTQERPSPISSGPSYGYYHMPETPPSSSTSSPSTPSFSPTDHYANLAQRPALATGHQTYAQNAVNQYGAVKVEEDSYALSHDVSHSNGYSTSMHVYGANQAALNQWGTYSDPRG